MLGGLAVGKALFVDPIKSAGDFQQSLSVLQATSHATNARMKEISATAMKLGADAKLPAVSASDAANAMLELAKGGFSAKESMEGARGVLLLSTAAQIDGATAATLVADSLHAFGMRAKDAGVVVNDFAGAANASTASMSEVGQSLQQSGQAFHQLGVPIGDATTAIAAMANAGIKGSDAGTSLKTMLQRLNPQTTQAKAAMAAMGVSAFDSAGKFVGMREVIAQMGPKLRGMTQEQRQQTLATIFGSDASRAAGIILGQTTAQWDKQHAAVTRAGQAQKLADAQTKGFKGAMSQLRSTIENVQLQIGLKMLPVLTTFVRFLSANLPVAVSAVGKVFGIFGDALRDVADWLGIFSDKAEGIVSGTRGMGAASDDAASRFGRFVAVVREIASAVSGAARTAFTILRGAIEASVGPALAIGRALVGFFQMLNENRATVLAIAAGVGTLVAGFIAYEIALRVAAVATRVAAAAQLAFNLVMAANPIMITIVAIAALVGALVLLYQRSETARKIMDAAWASIKAGAQAAMNFITNTVIPAAIAAWNRFGPQVVAVLSAAASGIRTAVNAIATVVRVVVDQIEAHWRQVWAVIGPVVVAALTVVRTSVQTVLNVIAGVVRVFAALLRGDWSAAWNALKGIVSDVLNGIRSNVSTILRGLAGTARALAILIGTAIAAGIKTAPDKLAGLAGDLAGKIASVAGQAAGSAFSYMRQVGFAIADGVLSGIGNLGARIASAVGGAARSAASKSLIDIIASSPSRLYADVVGKAIGEGVIVGVRDSLAKLGAYTGTTLRRISSELAPVASQLASDLAGVSGKAADAIIKKADAKLKPIGDAFEKWAKNAKAKFDAGMAALITGVDAQFARAQAKIDAWKAKATPTEARLAAQQALAAYTAVQLAVGAANAALANLKTKQAQDWASLMATQRANMASLQASFNESRDSALLAGNTFQKGMGAAAGNPFAAGLIAAQAAFNATKLRFDQGLATQAEFIAAADALEGKKFAAQQAIDAASAASTEATEAQKLQATQAAQAQTLLDQYNTWQTSLAQETAAGASITTQKATDFAAQEALQQTFGADIATATTALNDALATQHTYALEQQAAREREAKDARAAELNAALVQRHNRILEHLNNVQHAWDLHFNELARMASASGTQLTNNIANALRNGQQTVAGAANAVANTIASYLRLKSPAEKGPMSNLDQWWSRLAPTLVRSLDDSMIKAHLTNAVTPNPTAQGNLGAPGPDNARYGFHTSKMEWYLERIHKVLKDNNKPGVKPAPVEVHVVGGIGVDASVYRSRR